MQPCATLDSCRPKRVYACMRGLCRVHVLPLSLTTMLPRSRSFDRSVLTTLSSIGEQWGAWHGHGGERLCNRALPLIHAAPNVCTLACVVCVGACASAVADHHAPTLSLL